ncbi:hypothetical protein ABRA89_06050 [Fulvimarina sp. MAC8]
MKKDGEGKPSFFICGVLRSRGMIAWGILKTRRLRFGSCAGEKNRTEPNFFETRDVEPLPSFSDLIGNLHFALLETLPKVAARTVLRQQDFC